MGESAGAAGAAAADRATVVHLNARTGAVRAHVFSIAFRGSGARLAFRLTYVFEDAVRIRLQMDQVDNMRIVRLWGAGGAVVAFARRTPAKLRS